MYRFKWNGRSLLMASVLLGNVGCATSVEPSEPGVVEAVPPIVVGTPSDSDSDDHHHDFPAAVAWAERDLQDGLHRGSSLTLRLHGTEGFEAELSLYRRVNGALTIEQVGRHALGEALDVAIDLRRTQIAPSTLDAPAQVYVRAEVFDAAGQSIGFTGSEALFVLPSEEGWLVAAEAGLRAHEGLGEDEPVVIGRGRMLPDVRTGDPAQDAPLEEGIDEDDLRVEDARHDVESRGGL